MTQKMKRIALITGVTGRLGTDFCKRYKDEYAIVGVARKGDPPDGCARMIHADVAKDYDRIIDETLSEFGRIDFLINNAAAYKIKSIDDLKPEEMLEVLNVNVVAPFALTRRAYLKFWSSRPERNKKFRRHVMHLGSVSAFQPHKGQMAYGPSKAALEQLNQHLTRELETCNILSSIIHPSSFPRIISTEDVTDLVVKVDRGTETIEDYWKIQKGKHEKISTS